MNKNLTVYLAPHVAFFTSIWPIACSALGFNDGRNGGTNSLTWDNSLHKWLERWY